MKTPLRYALYLLFLSSFVACNWFGVDGYKISGKLAKYENKPVYLDELMYGTSTTIDTVETDKNGEFELQGHVREKGIYRIRTASGTSYFLILDNKLHLHLTGSEEEPMAYTITGGLESVLMHRFIDTIYQHNMLLDAAEQQYIKLQQGQTNDSLLQVFRLKEDERANQYMNYVKNYVDTSKNYLVALFASSMLNPEHDLKTLKNLASRLEKEFPNSAYTHKFIEINSQYVEDIVGKKFVDIELPDLDKKIIKLSSLKGKVILLDFWASWCKPCREKNPDLVRIYNKYKKNNFTIFSVSLDDEAGKWYDAVKADKLEWPYHVSDLRRWETACCKDYFIQQIPTNFLIDTSGTIIARNIYGPELNTKLNELLITTTKPKS